MLSWSVCRMAHNVIGAVAAYAFTALLWDKILPPINLCLIIILNKTTTLSKSPYYIPVARATWYPSPKHFPPLSTVQVLLLVPTWVPDKDTSYSKGFGRVFQDREKGGRQQWGVEGIGIFGGISHCWISGPPTTMVWDLDGKLRGVYLPSQGKKGQTEWIISRWKGG